MNNKRIRTPHQVAIALLFGMSSMGVTQAVGAAPAVTVFSENFEGYTAFPSRDPRGVSVNAGIPRRSEGASETWYGARFETPDGGTVDNDLAVQQFGGGTNNTRTGRTEDDAGLLFKLNTTNLDNITLRFDWRTFLADTSDRFVVGYHVGPIANFGSCSGNGEAGCFGDLRTTLPWYVNQNAQINPALTGNWTQLLRDTRSNAWQSESFLLPNAIENNQEVWFAFWLDNGENDFAQIDNVVVTAVPEADTWAMMIAGLGLVGLSARRRKQRQQSK